MRTWPLSVALPVIFSLACGVTGSTVVMEPFGFPLGGVVTEEVLEAHGCKVDDIVLCESAPTDLGGVEAYVLVQSTEGRIAKVMAVTDPIVDPDAAVQRYVGLRAALLEKYGEPTRERDDIKEGSLWAGDDPINLSMSLKKEDRTLVSIWNLSSGVSIVIEARSRNGLSTYIEIAYEHDELLDRVLEDATTPNTSAL